MVAQGSDRHRSGRLGEAAHPRREEGERSQGQHRGEGQLPPPTRLDRRGQDRGRPPPKFAATARRCRRPTEWTADPPPPAGGRDRAETHLLVVAARRRTA